jgi:SDR family mycofactocin-dependent oxidoreductase
MGRVDGKVALITGAGRGQGRSHAIFLAREGAAIIATDICSDIDVVPYSLASSDDLAETVRLVEKAGGRIIAREADVRSTADMEEAVQAGMSAFGKIDVVCANAGINTYGRAWELTDQQWQDVLDVNLTGVWRTTKAAIPQMIERGEGGSIIITASGVTFRAFENMGSYTAAKTGLLGLSRILARELGPHHIRVNTLHPCTVPTGMIENDATAELFNPGGTFNTAEERLAVMAERLVHLQLLPIPWVETSDLSLAVVYLASDESRFVTATEFRVDGGHPHH